jgi:predicted MPP superfamily phosphohydrolase
MIIIAILVVVFGLVAVSVLTQLRGLTYPRIEVPIHGLPPAFDGLTIVQISDTHVGIWTKPRHIRQIVARVNEMQPDLIVLTGDYVNRFERNCTPSGRSLRGLKAKHGVYAVLGNHDYWVNAEAMTKALRETGVDVLFDDQRRITIGKESITLVGLDDEWEGKPDYDKAFKGISADNVCIALAHNPDAVLHLEGKPISLLVSGHTHGGIINLPRIGPIFTTCQLGPKYASGMFKINGIRIYISRGIGLATSIPFRIHCPPEVPVFILKPGP